MVRRAIPWSPLVKIMEDNNDMFVRAVTPQHDHLSDDDASNDEEMDMPHHHQIQELGYSSSRSSSRRRGQDDDGGGAVYRGAQELHHRTTAGTRQFHRNQNQKTIGNRHVSTSRASSRNNPFKRKKWSSFIRGSIVVSLAGYFLLMVRQSWVLTDMEREKNFSSVTADLPPFDRRGMRATRHLLEKKRLEDRRMAIDEAERRWSTRMQYTRPPPSTHKVNAYTIVSMEHRPASRRDMTEESVSATFDELCGVHAKNASLEHPNSFLSKDALNSKSRVMITGILNPIGFHLALALKERCGVQVITGIDPMFPNTVARRLALQKRIQLLTRNIPKLVQPIVLPHVGLDPRLSRSQLNEPTLLPVTGEISLLNFRPTHIVHLASYAPEEYMVPLHPDLWNQQSPYVTPQRNSDLYRIRSSLASMEQILASVVDADYYVNVPRPHLVYASSVTNHYDPLHVSLKTSDEVLADTYHSLYNAFSVGVRLPSSVYGPWGRAGSATYQLADAAVANRSSVTSSEKLLESAGLGNATDRIGEFVYVSDVVDELIAAMQFRTESDSPILFETKPESRLSQSSAASVALNLMQPDVDEAFVASLSITESPLVQQTKSYLKWEPTTTLREGMVKMLAWHLDKESSAARSDSTALSSTAAGDAFLQRHGVETCTADDVICLSGRKLLPCVSECPTAAQCIPSVFDDVVELMQEVTEECDYILYTQSLGYNVKELKLQANYNAEGDPIVCNFAFIPRESSLVDTIIKKVPDEQLAKFGISPSTFTKKSEFRKEKRNGLNGRLLYKGWILVWVKAATTPLPTSDKFLLKLNPGKFFSKDVKRALFVDENFPVSPNLEDVLFLIGEVHRDALGARSVYQNGPKGKKHKVRLQPEPERRAVMLLSPLKQRASSNSKETALADGQKLTANTASKYMRYEIGEDASHSEAPEKKKQREFYERIASFVNRVDMRSPEEPLYRYELKHWIRTRWIVHDMTLEEGRELRCDWYDEHVQWGNDLDQLTFAHVMARREVERRMGHQEPDDHIKPPHVQHPELKLLTDAHEWHPYMGREHRLDSLGKALVKVPEHMASDDDREDGEVEADPVDETFQDSKVPLFVRIMSERVMMFARQQWAARHGIKPKKRKRLKKKR